MEQLTNKFNEVLAPIAQATPPKTLITVEQFVKIVPAAPRAKVASIVNSINEKGPAYGLTKDSLPEFIAQYAEESDSFKAAREYASGKAYEGRRDLGNVEPGDGQKFAGRSFGMITGRLNYRAFSLFRFGDERLLLHPEILEGAPYDLEGALWFFCIYKKLLPLAIANDFLTITKRINGGTNGLADREKFYKRALTVLG